MTKTMGRTHEMVYIAVFAVLIAVCSWISIPTEIPFTLQTMGIILTGGILGGKRATIAVLIYILLGAVGVPVFSGFVGGLNVLAGCVFPFISPDLIKIAVAVLIINSLQKVTGRRFSQQ